ncbi:MAG: prolyl oligopeptidase family serine peptidase [Pseudomonadales bacterium]
MPAVPDTGDEAHSLRWWLGAFLFLLTPGLLLGGAARAQPPGNAAVERLPLEAFASLPAVETMALAPGGGRLALLGNPDGRPVLFIRDPGADAFRPLLVNDSDRFHINWLHWASDEWLLVSARYPARRHATDVVETRLVAVDAVSGRIRQVVRLDDRPDGTPPPQFQDEVVDFLPDDPRHVLMALALDGEAWPSVYRVDILSGSRRLEQRARPGFYGWLTDQQHRVRIGLQRRDATHAVYLRPPQGGDWQLAWRFEAFGDDSAVPLGFGRDPDELYVAAYHKGFQAVFRVDLSKPGLPRTLVLSRPHRDVGGGLIYSPASGEAVGVVAGDGSIEVWDAGYRPFLQGLEQTFNDRRVWLISMSRDERRYLALTESDRDAGTYYYGDRDAATLVPIGQRYPLLPEAALSGRKRVAYEARDGTEIEGFLTLPRSAGQAPLPAVVFPHGGPAAMADDGFDYWAEFLASRGYAVLQMNFRGSVGYGVDFLSAGLGNWGRVMQDDVDDGTAWLIRRGIADPRRICIVGASYGGYAALMGVARADSPYRCAVSFAGVTDLADLVRDARDFSNSDSVKRLVGDDMRDLRARSPVNLAERIEVPVLLVQGTDDRRVDINQGRSMYHALQAAGAEVRYVEQDGGDHFLSREAHRLQLFREMEAFLERHLHPDDPG